jgi:hypothetical protein
MRSSLKRADVSAEHNGFEPDFPATVLQQLADISGAAAAGSFLFQGCARPAEPRRVKKLDRFERARIACQRGSLVYEVLTRDTLDPGLSDPIASSSTDQV